MPLLMLDSYGRPLTPRKSSKRSKKTVREHITSNTIVSVKQILDCLKNLLIQILNIQKKTHIEISTETFSHNGHNIPSKTDLTPVRITSEITIKRTNHAFSLRNSSITLMSVSALIAAT